ncbi:MAG TPA: dihydrolipoyl dehydrogenase [Candidatus Aminicenantes bacterium]|nr:dihydrolipoyl dehydrogenase [Candidatus Aminicenantes bacterium]HRY66283.1 dihydrolipoyl dehydrogenase [Candidatus Aminicenantes bacterium]HRZ73197.1 dihydrolipoyl dehydrogenase [Candidatus Aminicenantes bacterium]
MAEHRDLVIIGGGPGGYLAAMRAAQLGKTVTLIDQDRVGGTCINYGCIPTKYLLHQTRVLKELAGMKTLEGPAGDVRLNWSKVQQGRQAVVDQLVKGLVFLLEKGKVEIVKAPARLRADRTVVARTGAGERAFQADAVIVATGSRAAGLPFLQADGRAVITSTEALTLPEAPKSLLIIGAGAIGLEMGSIYRRLGTDVTVLEILPQILPGSDKEAVTRLERALKKQGLKIFTEVRIDGAAVEADGVALRGVSLKTNAPFEYRAEKVLLSAGRKPNTADLFEGEPCLALDRGFVKVDAGLRTSVPGIYAIGDVVGGKLLAHKAYHDALVAVANAAGMPRTVDYSALPAAVFTEPEFASVGLTQEEAAARGIKVKSGVFPLQASGRAMTMEATDGLVKVLADEADKVIGAHVVAPGASDMIPVLTMAVSRGLTLRELDGIIYIHPTLSEAVGEAALKANNEALHILNS